MNEAATTSSQRGAIALDWPRAIPPSSPCANPCTPQSDKWPRGACHHSFKPPLCGYAQQGHCVLEGSKTEMAGQPKRSNRACRRAWRFTIGCRRRSRPLNASRSNAQSRIAPGRAHRTCSLAKFGLPSTLLAATSPSSTAALAGSSCSSCAMEGKRSVKSAHCDCR